MSKEVIKRSSSLLKEIDQVHLKESQIMAAIDVFAYSKLMFTTPVQI